MQASGWTWSTKKRDFDAARYWGLIPSQFYSLDRDDKLDCLALYEIGWRVEAVNDWERNEKMNRKNRPKGRRR